MHFPSESGDVPGIAGGKPLLQGNSHEVRMDNNCLWPLLTMPREKAKNYRKAVNKWHENFPNVVIFVICRHNPKGHFLWSGTTIKGMIPVPTSGMSPRDNVLSTPSALLHPGSNCGPKYAQSDLHDTI
jgi:hypothetical protein